MSTPYSSFCTIIGFKKKASFMTQHFTDSEAVMHIFNSNDEVR